MKIIIIVGLLVNLIAILFLAYLLYYKEKKNLLGKRKINEKILY